MFRSFKLNKILSLFFLLGLAMPVFAAEKLVFAVDLIRHGDRTPVAEISRAPFGWKEGLGALTAEGMQQEYQLGVSLRKKYVNQYHLLPADYQAETIYVRSTDMNRTLMSATSFLLGLYPLGSGATLANSKQFALPAGFQPIPIHTVAIKQDKLLAVKPSKNIFSIISRYIFTQRTSSLFKDKIPALNKATGMQINTLHELSDLADNLYIRKVHHISLPAGIKQNEANEIMALAEKSILATFKRKEMTYPMGHEFLLTVANYMRDIVHANSPLKYILFSGHDSSIMAVMNTLGSPVNKIPGYASDLNFSLWQDGDKYYVKVMLNNQAVMVPGCNKNICSIEQFYSIAKK